MANNLKKTDSSFDNKIHKDLKKLGLGSWGLRTHEAHFLPRIIHPDEDIGGAIAGYNEEGVVMLVATDRRMIYLDIKPLFKKYEDISYEVVAGLTLEWISLSGILILNTRLGDFKVRTTNKKAALIFRDYVEKRRIEKPYRDTP